MILTAAFQFAMGFLAIMLRYWERGYFQPVVEGIKRCFCQVFWLATCGRCSPCLACLACCPRLCCWRRPVPPPEESPDSDDDEAEVSSATSSSREAAKPMAASRAARLWALLCVPLLALQRGLLKVIRVPFFLARSFRWYWFHLAGQAGFIVREICVIQTLDGWYWEVCTANIAMWMVLLLTARQIWQFSKVREKSPKAVDQILDMLLLPINYGFLCALCVRILKLENTGQNRTIVSAMIDSADIWEAWALWSVLRLFVRIVDKGSERMVEQEKERQDAWRTAALPAAPNDSPPLPMSRSSRGASQELPSSRRDSELANPLVLDGLDEDFLEVDVPPRRSISWSHPGAQRSERMPSDEMMLHFHRYQTWVEDRENPQEAEEVQPGVQSTQSLRATWEVSPMPSDKAQEELAPEPADPDNGSHAISTEFSPGSGRSEEEDEHRGTGRSYLEVVNAFKRLSLTGVQAWVAILLVTTTCEILFKGILEPTMPTLCYHVYGSCEPCNVWYDEHIYATTQGIIYILCSAALLFVIAFERAFKAYLHGIQPYWKFWGVKIVVSVTYFQWLLFKYILRLGDEEIYLWHSLICALEMPLLCIMHATYAYPYGREWVDNLLDELPEAQAANAKPDSASDASKVEEAPWLHRCCQKLQRCLHTSALFVVSAAASVLIICWLLPPSMEQRQMPPVYNLTCEEASVPGFLKEHHSGDNWQIHHYDGLAFSGQEWLPLCGSQSFYCPLGYKGHPVVSCSAAGKLDLSGSCQRVGCGPPLKVENADPIINFETYTSGMSVEYQCARGYSGRPSATCGPHGDWQFVGDARCSLIGCGSLQTFLQSSWKHRSAGGWQDTMTMTGSHDLDRSYVGETVRFTCSPGYWGRPVALCHEGGQWEITDPCVAFETSSKCRCKPRWVHCSGFLRTHCKEYYGCAFGAEAYTWCQVDPNSCPEEAQDPLGLRPAWDYCVNDNFNIRWRPETVADKGFLSKMAGLYIVGAFLLATVSSFYLFRFSAIALSWLGQWLGYLLLQVLLFFGRCVYRIPRALRRQCWVCGYRLHRLSGKGSQKLVAACASLRRSLGRSPEADDLSAALLEEGSRPVPGRCVSWWRPLKRWFSRRAEKV